jgi:hypothetical protein
VQSDVCLLTSIADEGTSCLMVQQDQNTLGSKLAVAEGGDIDGDEVADD